MMRMVSLRIVTVGIVLFLCASPVMATLTLADGGVYNIDYTVNGDILVDFEAPGMKTTLNILDGALLGTSYNNLEGREDSIINVRGGSIQSFFLAYDHSQVNISGGVISDLVTFDRSQVIVGGGTMGTLVAIDNSQVIVSDGAIQQFGAMGSGQLSVSGGTIQQLAVLENSQVTVAGGTIQYMSIADNSQATVSGGLFAGRVGLSSNAVLEVHGSDFAVDGIPVGYTELTSIFPDSPNDEPIRRLTGTLLNGDPFDNDFIVIYDAKIVLVPEPATLLLLGLGGLFFRRRR